MKMLPKAVQRANAEAAAIQEQIAQDLARQAGVDPSMALEAQPVAPDTTQQQQPAPAAPTVEQAEFEKLEQRYRTLQGMIAAKDRDHAAQLAQRDQALQSMSERLAEIESRAQAPQKSNAGTLVTEKDLEEFGPDMVDLITRRAREIVADERSQLEQTIQSLQTKLERAEQQLGMVTQSAVQSDQERYLRALAGQVPDWEAINVDRGFLAWLDGVDELTGFTRQDVLNTAYRNQDAGRTAAVFRAYKATLAPTASPKDELQDLVSPGTRTAPTPATNDRGRLWTGREYEQLIAMKRQKKISAEEFSRLEAEFNQALAEGRVRP